MDGYGKKIREARRAAHLTQAQLGAQIGVDRVTVSNWEREQHEVQPLTAVRLCEVLKSLKIEEIVPPAGLRELAAASASNGSHQTPARFPASKEAVELATLWEQLPADNLTKKYVHDAVIEAHKKAFPDYWLWQPEPRSKGFVKSVRKR